MKPLRNLSIRTKLFGGFGVVILLLLLVVAVSVSSAGSMTSAAHRITRSAEPDMIAGDDLQFAVAQLDGDQNQYLLDRGKKRAAFDAQVALVRHHVAAMAAAAAGTPAQEALAHQTSQALTAYLTDDAHVYSLLKAGRLTAAIDQANSESSGRFIAALYSAAQRFVTNARSERVRDMAQFESERSSAVRTELILAVVSLIIALAVAALLTRSIKTAVDLVLDRIRSLQEKCVAHVREGVAAFAEGDLTRRYEPVTPTIPNPSEDELGQVAQAVNAIRDAIVETIVAYNESADRLSMTIGHVADAAGSVNASSQQMASTSEETGRASGEIATAVSDVAGGAERQVRMIEDTRRSAEEVSNAVTDSATQAQLTAEAANQAREIALEGVSAADQASAAMQSVRESSEQVNAAIAQLADKSGQIGQIVQTITGIAEQTNLLALNAAIEAARAGEQGKGFAVVAEEVRKLAEESQTAAEEISLLIGAIQNETTNAVAVVENGAERTREGVVVVERTREAFEAIGSSVQDISSRVEQIAAVAEQVAASAQSMQENINEVAAVAEQSSASTEQVSASTEETSASAEQIAASAQELAASAQELNELVGQFRVTA